MDSDSFKGDIPGAQTGKVQQVLSPPASIASGKSLPDLEPRDEGSLLSKSSMAANARAEKGRRIEGSPTSTALFREDAFNSGYDFKKGHQLLKEKTAKCVKENYLPQLDITGD